jgi:hypothetical protein
MKKSKNPLRFLSLLIFSLGIFVGLAIAGSIIWGDLEASLFDSSIKPRSTLRSLNCPVAITTNEAGKITATLKNPTDQDKNFYMRAHISEGYVSLMREITQQIPTAPGESSKVAWDIYPKDAAYNRLVLFRVYIHASYQIPSQGNYCGVLVLDIPGLTGQQFFFLLLGVSLVAVIGGRALWQATIPQKTDKIKGIDHTLIALAGIIYGTLLTGFLGFWFLGLLLFAVSVLLIGSILGRYIFAV